MRLKTTSMLIVGAAALAVGLSGCATKEYVNETVTEVETRQTARLDELDKTSREALERAIAAGKLAEGKFNYAVTLSDDAVKFPLNRSELSPEAQARLAQLAERLKTENKNVYLEIQGHTDATGAPEYNAQLGDDRARAARLFLNKSGVPLNRMATISYGEDAPVAPNNSRDGRAQNRRVVIIVMS